MSNWTLEQFLKHLRRHELVTPVNSINQLQSTENERFIEKSAKAPSAETLSVYKPKTYQFSVPGAAMGKPRMTQRDVWQKRPVVIRYREYCDRIRAAAGTIPPGVYAILITVWLPMPPSWSQKKKAQLNGKIVQQKPDWDNLAKAVGDALLKDDSILGGGTCWKFWCYEGEEKTDVTLLLNV